MTSAAPSPGFGQAAQSTAADARPATLEAGLGSPHATAGPGEPRLGHTVDYEKFLDCVHCGLCTAACPTYLETADENNSPRGRIYLMRAVTDGRLELTPAVERHLDLCLDCRSCETACPSGVQYGRLIEPFRVEMRQRKTGTAPQSWFQRWVLYGLFPYPERLKWALWPMRVAQRFSLDRWIDRLGVVNWAPEPLQRMHRLLPRLAPRQPALPSVLPAIGPKRARVALFTGCVAEALFQPVNWATARVLQANGCEVVVPRQQVCCGAIHYHSGAGAPALSLAQQNVNSFPSDVDAVIINVAGCGSMLKDYGHMAHEVAPDQPAVHNSLGEFAGKVRDVHEFLAELGPISPAGELPLTATYHDACHLVHAQRVREQPRQLLELIPGLKLVPLAESDICCGAAGSYNLTEGEMADRLGRRKRDHILATGADCVISANAGCTLQMSAMLKESERPLPVVHPMELLDWSYRRAQPDWLPVRS
jgi:glycolate oxidase iron-sulfur subunit